MYCEIYQLSKTLSKRDRFGIYIQIEQSCLSSLRLALQATLSARQNKKEKVESLRLETEVLKRLIRLTHDINTIPTKKYLSLQGQLQEISKMANGWIKYLS
jgi:four helix bundle protein